MQHIVDLLLNHRISTRIDGYFEYLQTPGFKKWSQDNLSLDDHFKIIDILTELDNLKDLVLYHLDLKIDSCENYRDFKRYISIYAQLTGNKYLGADRLFLTDQQKQYLINSLNNLETVTCPDLDSLYLFLTGQSHPKYRKKTKRELLLAYINEFDTNFSAELHNANFLE